MGETKHTFVYKPQGISGYFELLTKAVTKIVEFLSEEHFCLEPFFRRQQLNGDCFYWKIYLIAKEENKKLYVRSVILNEEN